MLWLKKESFTYKSFIDNTENYSSEWIYNTQFTWSVLSELKFIIYAALITQLG